MDGFALCAWPGCHNSATRVCEECHHSFCRRHSGWYSAANIPMQGWTPPLLSFVCLCEHCLNSAPIESIHLPATPVDQALAE
jgi:hypothetical protein